MVEKSNTWNCIKIQVDPLLCVFLSSCILSATHQTFEMYELYFVDYIHRIIIVNKFPDKIWNNVSKTSNVHKFLQFLIKYALLQDCYIASVADEDNLVYVNLLECENLFTSTAKCFNWL